MKFKDKDITGHKVFSNGVVLKLNQDNVLDSADDEDNVAIYLYINEVNALIGSSSATSAVQAVHELPVAFVGFVSNSADLQESTVVLNAAAVRDCPTAKRNRAFVFIALSDLKKIKTKLDTELKRNEQIRAFDKTFDKNFAAVMGAAFG